MKTAAAAVVLGIATIAATGCDREPTSPTAYNNSGATAAGTSPSIPAPPPPNIQPATGDLAIPNTVPSAPQTDPATATPGAPATTATVSTTMTAAVPDTASPNAPPASSLPAQPAATASTLPPQSAAPTAPAADASKPAEAPSQAPR